MNETGFPRFQQPVIHIESCICGQMTRKGNSASRNGEKMKKIFMMSLSAVLLLAGCSSGTAAGTQEPEQEPENTEETEVIELEADPQETELETMDVSRMPSGGEYYGNSSWTSYSDMFVKGYEPSIALFNDGTFYLTENLLSGMGSYTGTFEMDDAYGLVCKVKSVSFKGYKGDTVKEIRLSRVGAYQLQLETDLCGSSAGNLFSWVPSAAGAGSYISKDDNFEEVYKPAVVFNNDGTFAMKENFYEGMGRYSGAYAFDGNQWICRVQAANYNRTDTDFIVFSKFGDQDVIYLHTDLCASRKGTEFVKTDSVDVTTPGMDGSAPGAPMGYEAGPVTNDEYKAGTVFIVANASSNRIKVRSGPGLSAPDTGDRMYNGQRVAVYEETVKDGYTWYRIGVDRWMAGNGKSFGVKYD